MKISLPNILRTALIACFAQFVPIITIATASLVAISAQAQAEVVIDNVINTSEDAKLISTTLPNLVMDLDVAGTNESYLYATGDVIDCVANIEVREWKINNGSSGRTYNFSGAITSSTSVSESGDINYTWTGQNTYNFSGDMSGFAGDINVTNNASATSSNADLDLIFSGTAREALSGTGSILSDGVGSITYNTTGSAASSVTNTKIEVDGGVKLTFQGDGSTYNVSSEIIAGALAVGANTTVNFTGLVNQYSEGGTSLTVLAGGTANFTHDSQTAHADFEVGLLHGEGTVNVKNLKILRNTSSDIQINASGTVSLVGESSFASIKADSVSALNALTTKTSLTLTGANTSSTITGNATTGALTLSNSSALNVTGILTTTSITVNGSTGASITTPLISAGSIAAESLIISLTESALASMDFGDDGKFTLINLGAEFAGDIIFSVEGYKEATLVNGGKDLIIWGGYTQYIITSDTSTTSGQQIFIQEGERIPEPSTATLSLLALAGLLARRRRKQA